MKRKSTNEKIKNTFDIRLISRIYVKKSYKMNI